MALLAKGSTVVTVDAGQTIVFNGLDLRPLTGREITLAIAYDNLTTYTGVNALLRWGIASLGSAQMAAGVDSAGAADTNLVGTSDGAYSKRMHIGGDRGEIFLDPAGTGGSVTVHWAVIG